MEITPGIYQIEVPLPNNNPLGHLNAYLIQGTDGWLLVDTGWDFNGSFGIVEKQLQDLGLGFDAITQIVITHVHVDHYGLIGKIKEASGAKTAFHEKEATFVQARAINRDGFPDAMAQQLVNNGIPMNESSAFATAMKFGGNIIYPSDPPDIVLQDGDIVSTGYFTFEVIWTPGHSWGHICLYERDKRILLTGDHVLPGITPNINLRPGSEDNPLGSYLASLRMTRDLEVDMILPAHEHVFNDLRRRIGEIISHHEERLHDAMSSIQHDAKTAYQIASELPWLVNPQTGVGMPFANIDALGKGLATGETLAHLEYLRVEGKLERETKGDILFYKAVAFS